MIYLENTLPTIDSQAQKFLDQSFAEESGLPTLVLMEQAAMAVTSLIEQLAEDRQNSVLFLAGAGNNGGDAWASARQLLAYGFSVEVLELFPDKKLPPDALKNKKAYLKLTGNIIDKKKVKLNSYDFIIDGIMGTGFNLKRPLDKDLLNFLSKVNSLENVVRLAIDIPTGIDSSSGACDQIVFAADYTLTFSALKTGMMAEPGCAYCGQVILAPISMSETWIEKKLDDFQGQEEKFLPRVLSLDTFQKMEIPRTALSHKGNFGKTLLLGGSKGMNGAILLALRAAHASGVGYAYIRVPEEIVSHVLASSPESLIDVYPKDESTWSALLDKVDSVALGPGAGQAKWLDQALDIILEKANNLIIDADGLNYLARLENWTELAKSRLKSNKNPLILTPHPGEFTRLAPDLKELLLFDRQEAARILAERSSAIIVLKGHTTVIAMPNGEVYLNSSGNQALAKAGSGDVLTGLAAGFLAQYQRPQEAISLAVYFHGLLADLAVDDFGIRGVLPSELMNYASSAYQVLGWFNLKKQKFIEE